MASNSIVLKGTTYNGVSSLEVPLSGGGNALFTDVSDTTAAAADVASGKYFYDALGAYTQGTASGGGGGLETESGTWTPTSDVSDHTITFSNTHTTGPFYYVISDITQSLSEANSCSGVSYSNFYRLTGYAMNYATSSIRYALAMQYYKGSSATTQSAAAVNITTENDTTWGTSTGIRAYCGSETRYWRAGRTYKWVAVWAPTS